MRAFARVAPQFWTGETGKQIRALGRDAQVVAIYLVTCPSSTMLGLYYLPIPTLCHEVGISKQGALKALRSLSEAPSKGGCGTPFCVYDEPSETVFVTNMARFQVGDSLSPKDNQVKAIRREAESLRKSPLYREFYTRYSEAFHFSDIRPFEGPSEPLRSQEQDQEKERDMGDSSSPASSDFNSLAGHRSNGNGSASHTTSFEDEFETEIKPVYPKRDGDQRWRKALGHYRAARKAGEAVELMAAGVKRYAAWCARKGLVGTDKVKQAGTFFGPEQCWREPWTAQSSPRREDFLA